MQVAGTMSMVPLLHHDHSLSLDQEWMLTTGSASRYHEGDSRVINVRISVMLALAANTSMVHRGTFVLIRVIRKEEAKGVPGILGGVAMTGKIDEIFAL